MIFSSSSSLAHSGTSRYTGILLTIHLKVQMWARTTVKAIHVSARVGIYLSERGTYHL